MILKSLILATSLIGSVTIVSNATSHLTQSSIKKQPNLNIFKTSEPKKTFSKQDSDWIRQAMFYNSQIQKQNMQLDSKKQYETGLNKLETIRGVMHVWVTKAYLGNVATVLGATGAGISLALGITALALTLYGVSAMITGGIGLIVMPIIAVIYGAATAYLMNKINSYDIGGYFKADFSLVGTPVTIMSTIRSQNQYESATRLKKFDSKIKFGNADSYDLLNFDKTNGKTRSFWTIGKEDQTSFIGVLDISRYTRYSHGIHIKSVQGSLGLRSDNDEIVNINDEKWQEFLTKYYKQSQHDYLFFNIEKISTNQYQLKVGGSDFSSNKEQSKNWLTRYIDFEGKLHDVALDLHIEIDTH